MRFFGDTGGEAYGHDHYHRAVELLLQGEAFTMWWH